MNKSKCCIVVTTTGSKENAVLIAKTLLDAKLAACVQVDEVESFFYYEANFRQMKEFRLIIKAASDKYSAIERSVMRVHSYKLPQIIKLDIIDGLNDYLEWVEKTKV